MSTTLYQQLADLGERCGSDAFNELAIFSSTSPVTIAKWAKGGHAQGGERLLRMQLGMAILGYPQEIPSVSPAIHGARLLVGLGIATVEDLRKDLDYKRPLDVRRMLSGVQPTATRFASLVELVTKYAELIPTAYQEWEARLAPYRLPAAEVPAPPPPEPVARRRHRQQPLDVVDVLAKQLLALKPLAELVVSDNFTAEDRERLHKLAGNDTVFKLSNMFNRLCSDSSRRRYLDYNRERPQQ